MLQCTLAILCNHWISAVFWIAAKIQLVYGIPDWRRVLCL